MVTPGNASSVERAEPYCACGDDRAQSRQANACFAGASLLAVALLAPLALLAQDRPDERRDANGVPLPAGAISRAGWVRVLHPGCTQSLLFTPDGQSLLSSAGFDSVIHVSDASSMGIVRMLRGQGSGVGSLSLSPDGSTLASSGSDGVVRLWDMKTGKTIRKLRAGKSSCAVAFSPDGTRLAAGGDDLAIHIWTAATGEELRALRADSWTRCLAWLPDGKGLFAAGEHGRELQLWNPETGGRTGGIELGDQWLSSLAVSADGKLAAGGGGRIQGEGAVRVWEVATGREIMKVQAGNAVESQVLSVVFTQDGRQLVSSGSNRPLLWEVPSGKRIDRFAPVEETLADVALSPDGRLLAGGTVQGRIHLWDAATGVPREASADQEAPIQWVGIASDGETLFTASSHSIQSWQATSGREIRSLQVDRPAPSCAAVSIDGGRLAYLLDGGGIAVHDLATFKRVAVLDGATKGAAALAFSGDGRLLACLGSEGQVALWETSKENKARILQLPKPGSPAPDRRGDAPARGQVSFSPDGKRFVVVVGAGDPQVVDLEAGKVCFDLRGHKKPAREAEWSPDGTMLASIGGDKTVRLWDASTGDALLEMDGHDADVCCVAWSPDGGMLATGDGDGLVLLWETASGQEVRKLVGHEGAVLALGWSSDGLRVASGSEDCTSIVWERRPSSVQPADLAAANPAALWEALADSDGHTAHLAVWTLALGGRECISLLNEKLSAGPDKARILKWVADLDSKDEEVRTAAAEELAKLGSLAEPSLRTALAGTRVAETKRALEDLLGAAARPGATAIGALQFLRAIEALEWAGTPEALGVLEAVAKGPLPERFKRAAAEAATRAASRKPR